MSTLEVRTNRTGHNIYVRHSNGEVTYIGPIALKHGDAIDVIPLALTRASLYRHVVSPDVRLVSGF
jgi:hypothetical protein